MQAAAPRASPIRLDEAHRRENASWQERRMPGVSRAQWTPSGRPSMMTLRSAACRSGSPTLTWAGVCASPTTCAPSDSGSRPGGNSARAARNGTTTPAAAKASSRSFLVPPGLIHLLELACQRSNWRRATSPSTCGGVEPGAAAGSSSRSGTSTSTAAWAVFGRPVGIVGVHWGGRTGARQWQVTGAPNQTVVMQAASC